MSDGLFDFGCDLMEGEVKRIVYRSADGYTVFRLATEDGEITCVGYLASINPGERIRVSGKWVTHPRYGRQLSLEKYEIIPPKTSEGIIRYLSSGLIKGIGRSTAERIVEHFGESTLEVIQKEPERLKEVPGVGPTRVEAITRAWKEQRNVSELILFLESHGIRASTALRIYRKYGAKSIEIIRENPYRLASEIWGIGFLTADRIAMKLGLNPDSPQRIEAGIHYVLSQATEEGHVYLPTSYLLERSLQLLGVGEDLFQTCLEALIERGDVIIEDERVYLPYLHQAEVVVAERLRELSHTPGGLEKVNIGEVIAAVESQQGLKFDDSQVRAIEEGLRSGFVVITGGPGTGKTTITKAFVNAYEMQGLRVKLAAPTGRAAKRMSELTGREAKTIHRLLEYNPQEDVFYRNQYNPVDADLVIVDEASMLDLLLASSLLKAISNGTSVVFVGDVDQLPPVGPGNLLRDVIDARRFTVKRLQRVFRQDEDSILIENAHRINRGDFPILGNPMSDFFLVEKQTPGEVAQAIVDLCARVLPSRLGMNPFEEIQVLAPMYKGDAGANNLNHLLQTALNPGTDRFRGGFRPGDKVMQLRNNYEKMVFNGDIGLVIDCDEEGGYIRVQFEHVVDYDSVEADELTLAYAVTVHKSQGSEFPCVVMPVVTQHYVMLYRNLLYTAVTRAEKLVALVGSRKALSLAIKNVRTDKRYSSLSERISRMIPA